MVPKEWKILLEFFKRLRQKAYLAKFENGRTVTMSMRSKERPLMSNLDELVNIAESELRLSDKNVKASRNAWLYAVSILRKERDFFDEFKKDKVLKQTLEKFLKRGNYENEI
tara:strand:- start:17188 stop:17523 length:336 start_codon:yes stop_codon:yes gene_type:complete